MSEIKKINVNGIEYELGSGGKLYKHELYVEFMDSSQTQFKTYSIFFEFVAESNNEITKEQFINYLNNYKYPEFELTIFYGVDKQNIVNSAISVANYGSKTFNFKAHIIESGTVTAQYFTLGSQLVESDVLTITLIDKVTPFITEV